MMSVRVKRILCLASVFGASSTLVAAALLAGHWPASKAAQLDRSLQEILRQVDANVSPQKGATESYSWTVEGFEIGTTMRELIRSTFEASNVTCSRSKITVSFDSNGTQYKLSSNERTMTDEAGLRFFHGDYSENNSSCTIKALRKSGSLLVEASDKDGSQGKTFSQNDFDLTSAETPTLLPALLGSKGTRSVRLLDLTKVCIKPGTIKRLDNEKVEFACKTFDCDVYEIDTPPQIQRFWIAANADSSLLLKQVTIDADGTCVILLMKRRPSVTPARLSEGN